MAPGWPEETLGEPTPGTDPDNVLASPNGPAPRPRRFRSGRGGPGGGDPGGPPKRTIRYMSAGGAALIVTAGTLVAVAITRDGSRTPGSVHLSIVSGGDLGVQSDPAALTAHIDTALSHSSPGSPSSGSGSATQPRSSSSGSGSGSATQPRSSSSGSGSGSATQPRSSSSGSGGAAATGSLPSATLVGPAISPAGSRCFAPAVADAGANSGDLLYVADLTWQGAPTFAYVFHYSPRVPRPMAKTTVTTSGARAPTAHAAKADRLLLLLADSDCHLETASFFS